MNATIQARAVDTVGQQASTDHDHGRGTAVLVVEDHLLVGELLVERLRAVEGVGQVLLARDVAPAVDAFKEHSPDVVLLDFRLPSGTGLDVVGELLALDPQAHVVMLSASADPLLAARAMDAGCVGFLDKTAPFWRVVGAVRAAARGERVLAAGTAAAIERFRHSGGPDADTLTSREREVLSLLAEGLSVTDIAEDLVLSTHTVRNHVRASCRKLRVSTQLQAVVAAVGQHVIPLPAPSTELPTDRSAFPPSTPRPASTRPPRSG